MAGRILGMGDMLTLIEQAEKAFDRDDAAAMAGKLQTERGLTLQDFLGQLQAVRKMGSLSKLLGMMPGMSEMRDQISEIDDGEVDRIEAIIRSMTPAERDDPRIINGSRRLRIARGSGTTVSDVGGLVERFMQARKMMSAMARGKGIPGMPGMPGMGAGAKKKQVKGKKAKPTRASGNPAKRLAQQQAAAVRAAEQAALPAGSANGAAPEVPENFELPKQFKDLLGQQGGQPGANKGPRR
jgi:signal recognition particle subunit SRP54